MRRNNMERRLTAIDKPHIRLIRRNTWACATYTHGGMCIAIGIGTTPNQAYNNWEAQGLARYGR